MFRNIYSKLLRLTLAMSLGMAAVGCTDDNNGLDTPKDNLPESGFITLSLDCVEGTRAYEEEGDDGLHENLIKSVTICLWANDGTLPDATAKPDYVQTFSGLDNVKTAKLRIPLTEGLKRKLFPTDPGICNVFAAVNVTPPTGDFTIAEFRQLAIGPDMPVGSNFMQNKTQPSFAMDGDSEVTYNPAANTATGSIDLHRSASKITLALAVDGIVEQSIVVDGTLVNSKWQPDTGSMRVWLNGGLSASTLDPNLEDTPGQGLFFDTPNTLNYSFKGNSDNGQKPEGDTYDYNFVQDTPFYTYPHRWSEEPGDYAATYMTLAIPWRQVQLKEGSTEENPEYEQVPNTTWRTCYYQVPAIAADSDLLQLVRNVSYHVYLHVGLLGSFIPDEPLELTDLEYSAAEWGNVDMEVKIPDVRYLVVDQNDYTVNNETSISIPFYTSHETIVTDATMTFYRYNFDDVGREMKVPVSWANNKESELKTGSPVFTAWFDNETDELIVSHELVMYEAMNSGGQVVSFTSNDTPTTGKRNPKTLAQWQTEVLDNISYFRKVTPSNQVPDVNEYSRVEFEIVLQHKDINTETPESHNFEETIRITQYPGIYIETVQNYCPYTTSFRCTGAQGNTFINGNTNSISGDDVCPSLNRSNGWMTSIGLSSGFNNYNPNLYLITVTTLPSGTEYRIGDPRSNEINNSLASNTAVAGITTSSQLKLVTSGVNGPILTGEQTTPWSGQTYTWDYGGPGTVTRGSVSVVGFAQGKAIYPNESRRTIRYYYPTYEDDAHKMTIAPKFRICSSYAGTTWILNRELARRRAAAYQELGYNAGRWRLPTFGEVKFVMELASQFKIPRLFGTYGATLATATQANSSWWYWCAQGLVHVPGKGVINTPPTLPGDPGYRPHSYTDTHRARFVYDEWYWGDVDLPDSGTIGSADCVYTFTWGDKPF